MIKTILSSLFAVFLFALGAAGSWYFVEYQKQREAEVTTDTTPLSDLSAAPDDTDSEPAVDGGEDEMPIPVHTRPISAEEVFRIGALHRKNIAALEKKKQQLRSEELQLQLVQKDIEAQKQEVEGILKQIQSTIVTGEQLLEEVAKQRSTMEAESRQRAQDLEEIQKATHVPDVTTKANIKNMATMLSSMAPEKAAEVIKELIQKGNMELALQLLSTMQERDAAKLLDSLNDPVLLADITERFRELPGSPPKSKRR